MDVSRFKLFLGCFKWNDVLFQRKGINFFTFYPYSVVSQSFPKYFLNFGARVESHPNCSCVADDMPRLARLINWKLLWKTGNPYARKPRKTPTSSSSSSPKVSPMAAGAVRGGPGQLEWLQDHLNPLLETGISLSSLFMLVTRNIKFIFRIFNMGF